MGDVKALRSTLSATDGTAPSIQASASSMMRMYDKSPSLAVAEWRNVLQTCSDFQLLPLLYVANEVMQISKRNRGNKYLESFSPVLGGSLKVICERDPSVTEKVRRTAKIWGDRRIFSTRYVGELLAGVEGYRDGKRPRDAAPPTPRREEQEKAANFSPQWKPRETMKEPEPEPPSADEENDLSDNDSIDFGNAKNENGHGGNDVNDDDPFASSGPSILDVSNFTVNKQALLQREASRSSFKTKRRRSSLSANNDFEGEIASNQNKKPKNESPNRSTRRKSALTTQSLSELVQQLSSLDSQSKSISRILSSITSSELYTSTEEVNEVGDELIELHTKVNTMIDNVKKQGRTLWHVAEGKRNIEVEFKRYLNWMKAGLSIDQEELKFCNDLEKKLTLLQLVHANAKKVRDRKRTKEAMEREIAEAAARDKAEKEELKRSLEKIQKQPSMNEVRPGMIWNKQTREYQYLDTEESWRD
mmetsp:Transcript_3283/g.4782  ORF Transcript_3283/g.4782 Transcript_3283/m.4782 type:complete len:475 (+) Transcript_3283:77-1501(+)|eukprot:CAMPEP_0203680794 /NCGR_PEP_ID=MMETSP0090-20130426/40626_1 /ASSEMBLY_ACC=CAM_ASM_001088 /TAXON_ID=426623 /ORGANISM="Chaetoceros affinis, Strain CCMP159" /LENGTH=474 /DNA_ID=CAMNT_0050549031 /DNA_START=51 /DNA_END=1475 /DNA_ORIENTATION=-